MYTIMYVCSTVARVRLSKRRGKAARSAMNSKLVVKHREMTEDEVYAQVCVGWCYTYMEEYVIATRVFDGISYISRANPFLYP